MQAIVLRAVERGEGFELVELAFFLEDLDVALDCDGCCEDAGNADLGELARHGMGCRIRAEKEARIARGRGFAQGETVYFRLDDRHHEHVGAQAAADPVGARQFHVIGRDARADLAARGAHVIDADLRRQMLVNDLETGELLRHRDEALLDEHGLAVEHVDAGRDFLAVDEKAHAELFHSSQDALDLLVVCDAGSGIRRGVGGVHFHRGEHAIAEAALDVVGIGVVGQVAGDQRLELRALRQRCEDALAVGLAIGGGAHGRQQVRHANGAAEDAGGVGERCTHHVVVAQVKVPVVGTLDCDSGGHGGLELGVRPSGSHTEQNVGRFNSFLWERRQGVRPGGSDTTGVGIQILRD